MENVCHKCKTPCPIVGPVAPYAKTCSHKKRPSFAAICRYKRMCVKKELPISHMQDALSQAFKRRGLYWVRSMLSWHPPFIERKK